MEKYFGSHIYLGTTVISARMEIKVNMSKARWRGGPGRGRCRSRLCNRRYIVKICFWVFRWSNAINQIDSKIIWEWPEQRAYCYECLVWDHLNTWASSQNKHWEYNDKGSVCPIIYLIFMFIHTLFNNVLHVR